MTTLPPLDALNPLRFDTPAILKKLASSSRRLAESKGVAASVPNQGILTGFLQKQKVGRSNYYVNLALNQILLDQHGE